MTPTEKAVLFAWDALATERNDKGATRDDVKHFPSRSPRLS